MQIVIFTHPAFLGSQSMPRYARMLEEGMKERGHKVETWTASPIFYKLPAAPFFKKWLGYIDQFVFFPLQIKLRLKSCSPGTLFVFSDHALGPWVPLVANRPHLIHCHDFLAQQSALGEITENKVGLSGKIYQAFIRKGYRKGNYFISISGKTRADLDHFLDHKPRISEVVYNGLNQNFTTGNVPEVRNRLSKQTGIHLTNGYILHVGGNQFYKNRKGVIEIYNTWRTSTTENLPLLMIGEKPTAELKQLQQNSFYTSDIHFLSQIKDSNLKLAYQGASVLLFPSLAEGFGWPIAEAMASGCLVVTTNEAPMTEVAGHAAFLISKRPNQEEQVMRWAKESAVILDQVIGLSAGNLQEQIDLGIENAKRFNTKKTLDQVEAVYKKVLESNHL